jgi:hypothetical protein
MKMSDTKGFPVCSQCGSVEVRIPSQCEWDTIMQEWVAVDPDYEGGFCNDCETDCCGIEHINYPLADTPAKTNSMKITIPLSLGETILLPPDENDLHGYVTDRYLDAAQEEFLERSPIDDRHDREIVIADVVRIVNTTDTDRIDLELTVECTVTDEQTTYHFFVEEKFVETIWSINAASEEEAQEKLYDHICDMEELSSVDGITLHSRQVDTSDMEPITEAHAGLSGIDINSINKKGNEDE